TATDEIRFCRGPIPAFLPGTPTLPSNAMSELAARIPEDMKNAMRAKDTVTLTVLRALKTAMTNASIEKGHLSATLDDAEIAAVIRKLIKQRQDSFEQFTNAGRAELAANEKAEIAVRENYLPAA